MKIARIVYLISVIVFFGNMYLGYKFGIFSQDPMTKQTYYDYPWWWNVLYWSSALSALICMFYASVIKSNKP